MYEKPQYLTNDGYKRMDHNPHGKKQVFHKGPLKNQRTEKELPPLKLRKKAPPLSDKAAKLIADALKSMLND